MYAMATSAYSKQGVPWTCQSSCRILLYRAPDSIVVTTGWLGKSFVIASNRRVITLGVGTRCGLITGEKMYTQGLGSFSRYVISSCQPAKCSCHGEEKDDVDVVVDALKKLAKCLCCALLMGNTW